MYIISCINFQQFVGLWPFIFYYHFKIGLNLRLFRYTSVLCVPGLLILICKLANIHLYFLSKVCQNCVWEEIAHGKSLSAILYKENDVTALVRIVERNKGTVENLLYHEYNCLPFKMIFAVLMLILILMRKVFYAATVGACFLKLEVQLLRGWRYCRKPEFSVWIPYSLLKMKTTPI